MAGGHRQKTPSDTTPRLDGHTEALLNSFQKASLQEGVEASIGTMKKHRSDHSEFRSTWVDARHPGTPILPSAGRMPADRKVPESERGSFRFRGFPGCAGPHISIPLCGSDSVRFFVCVCSIAFLVLVSHCVLGVFIRRSRQPKVGGMASGRCRAASTPCVFTREPT